MKSDDGTPESNTEALTMAGTSTSSSELMETTPPELPQDILMVILATLEIPDLVRAGSVCSSWRAAYSRLRSLGHYKHAQTPCLFYTSKSASDESVACLYSLAEKRAYKLTLPAPPISTRYLIGSSLGLLVTVDDRSEMHLVNPITGEQVDLPSVITVEQVKPIYDGSGALHKYAYAWWRTGKMVFVPGTPSVYALGELRDNLHHKAFVFPDDTCNRYLVVFIHNPFCQLSFARVGDDSWTWLPPHEHYHDCVYKDGLLYAATTMGEIHGFDLSSDVATMKTIMGKSWVDWGPSVYIGQSPSGNLLQVWRSYDHCVLKPEHGEIGTWSTGELEIDEVDAAGNKIKECICLPDHVLFLGHNQTLCLTAQEYPALKGNHAYFTDDSALWTRGFKNKRRDMGIFSLVNNTREKIVSPQLWSKSPAPVWITLDFTKMNLAFNK